MSIPKGVEADAWIAAAESPEDKPSLQQFPSALGPLQPSWYLCIRRELSAHVRSHLPGTGASLP